MALREIREQRKREAFKFTLEDMAELLGISLSTYRRLEEDPSRLTYEQALRVSERLLCDTKELF